MIYHHYNLSMAQASFSFECFDMHTPTYTTFTFITESAPTSYLCTCVLNDY